METKISEKQNEELSAKIAQRIIQVAVTTTVQAAVLFLAAGTLRWGWGWVWIGLYLLGIAINALVLFRVSPETIAERADSEGMRDWDKLVGGLYGLVYFLAIPVIAGLDYRYSWSGSTLQWVHGLGVLGFAVGFVLISWAMASNAFFSTVVRVQPDKSHQVVTGGPYRMVRHPGYLGMILHGFSVPLIVGSPWALVPGGIAALLGVVRTSLEDKTLQAELPGYKEFAQKTRYRLLPGIW